jgi:riboflavin kinase/FMN adenylyltransferase
LRVGLVDFLRAERKFDGVEALKAQIGKDCKEAGLRLAAGNWQT